MKYKELRGERERERREAVQESNRMAMNEGEGPPRGPTILHKRKLDKLEIVFDEKSRSDFIHGFRKRRKERQDYAKKQEAYWNKQEKSELRKEKWKILDKKVQEVEAVKDRAGRIYKREVQSTTAYESEEKIITATVTPLFGGNFEVAASKEEEAEESGVEEDGGEAEGENRLVQLNKKLKSAVPKAKPKRKRGAPGSEDKGNKRDGKGKRGGGRGGKRK